LIDGREPAVMHLHEASCPVCRWTVDVWFDGQGGVFLSTGWEMFAAAHHVDVGCLVHFVYDGDETMIVRIFDDDCGRVHDHGCDSNGDSDSDAGH
jgi:hypothetical protein